MPQAAVHRKRGTAIGTARAGIVDKAAPASLSARPYLPHGFSMTARPCAQMAELVDAPSSGGGARKGVEVRVLFWAPTPSKGLKTAEILALGGP